jgi:methylenetetrahydrofolate reductase (NADPH)
MVSSDRSDRHGIIEKLAAKQNAFSLEFFPPKKEMPLSSVSGAIERLAASRPAFVSVTFGAGGGSRERTLDIVSLVDAMGLKPSRI